jgi:epoxyqueuosine reductase
MRESPDPAALARLAADIRRWGVQLGFGAVAIADLDMSASRAGLEAWLAAGMHGEMSYMERHRHLRLDPGALVEGAIRAICVRYDYLPPASAEPWAVLRSRDLAYVSRYALGRDYHKVVRSKLAELAARISAAAPGCRARALCDSAPVMEVELARRSGLGWRGKHTLLLSRSAGSLFFLGEIYVDLALPVDAEGREHCGDCTACLAACPTSAIVGPYRLDARRCISYLTIEHRGVIPEQFRALIGNRVYGCDDCQLVCPWNRFAKPTAEPDFAVRHGLDRATLLELFAWSADDFTTRMAGSAIYRIGFEQWQRNIAVGIGNAPASEAAVRALADRREAVSAMVREHVDWALARQRAGLDAGC